MPKCNKCGGEIIFRHLDGIRTPLHLNGGCSHTYSDHISGFRPQPRQRIIHRYESYVNPNAHCPVCGVQVFFYRSPDNGRVFFDELGPPWPKHPCTDTSNSQRIAPFKSKPLPTGLNFEWQRLGWQPFECTKIEETEGGLTRITGRVEQGKQWTFYILGESRDLGAYPMLIKPIDRKQGNYQIATFRFEGATSEFKEIYINVHLPEKYR